MQDMQEGIQTRTTNAWALPRMLGGNAVMSFPAYIQVYNTAMNQQVSFEEIRFLSFEEARAYKQKLKNEYGAIGCHTVKVFMEVFPEEEEDIEEEFDADEMEEEE